MTTENSTLNSNNFKTTEDWLCLFSKFPNIIKNSFNKIYGNNPIVIENRRQAIIRLLNKFRVRFKTQKSVLICRAPGRINLLGRHIEHRGGFVNVMAIDKEIWFVAAPREDDQVQISNIEEQKFPDRYFIIAELLERANWTDWSEFITSAIVQNFLKTNLGDWSIYFRAPLLKLQFDYPGQSLRGMDCVVGGEIPIGSGLSSSSAIVVGLALIASTINNIELDKEQFIDLCCQAEWFVGSRGGGADHAAIFAGEQGHFLKIGFFPFQIKQKVRFPDNIKLVIANSNYPALKSAGAKDVFNQRVACYEFAQMYLRNWWLPAKDINRLRDLLPANLGIEDREIYQAIKLLPENMDRQKVRAIFSENSNCAQIEKLFATHHDIGPYDLRGVAMFGIGECLRSDEFANAFAQQKFVAVKKLIKISHNGDRLCCFNKDGSSSHYQNNYDDNSINILFSSKAPLPEQPGRYACSTEAIDHLVDIANEVDGVIGAQLAGAGLGGCAIILLKQEALDKLLIRLEQKFYIPKKLTFDVQVCSPVKGACLFSL